MSKFISNVIKLFSATLAGQVLGILVTPLLSRLYTPADFGIYQLFFSIVSIIGVVSCFCYEAAIQLSEKDEDAANIVVLCIIISFFTTLVSTLCLFIFSYNVENLLNAPGLSTYFLLFPLALLCNSFTFVFISWLARRDEFGTIAKGNLFSSILSRGASVGSGIISPSPFGLIFGGIINDATIVANSLKKIIRDIHFFQKVSSQRIRYVARRYIRFPLYNTGAALAGTASTFGTPLMLAIFFSPVIVGYYAMAFIVIRLPTKVIGSALSQVFYQKACADKNLTGSIKNIAETIHTRLISFGIFACLIFMIIGQVLFDLVLGSQWSTAGIYAQIIVPWIFIAFISTPLLSILDVLEKQGANFLFGILLLLTRVISVFIGGFYNDPILAMVLLSVTGVFFWGLVNIYTLKLAGVSVFEAMKTIILYTLTSLLFCLPLIYAKYLAIPTLFLIVITIFLSIVYYTIIIFRDTQLKQGLIKSIQGFIENRD